MDYMSIIKKLQEESGNDFKRFYETGFQSEAKFGCCGQSVILPFVKILGIDENIFKYASGFCGGIGQRGEYPCGAFNGSVMVLSSFFGRDVASVEDDAEESKILFRNTCSIVREFEERFIKKFGSVICAKVQTKIFGRSFNILDQDIDYPLFEKMGAHTDKCTNVVGTASKMAVALLYENLA